ncbi:CHAD domain-containing protein [Methanosarcina sp. KYL-1]|uniref:CHAD domain-containing protein n=1 Tax=Methanosarcina sp. KYL-1 TaxID=2602068 RepID=UPI0021014542|nr:CHAD domain-containing protein [Methanosarcina sp. KYL-1]MCQ1536008.1 CHAD domain-containing protein [Methanosarcina sp. KYL-1]
MEIESKFLVLDEAGFQAIEDLSRLGAYTLSEAEVQLIDDIFLDTEDRKVMAAGYYLRVRKVAGEEVRWVTIKSLGGFEGGTHRREEYVSPLEEGLSVLECPDLRIRNRIFEFTAGMGLVPLLALKQKRVVRQVKLGERYIAELYLDRVNLKSENREKFYCELEVELKSGGSIKDLESIREFLLEHYNLAESPFSKFERAFLFREELPEKTLLSLKERAFCMQLAGHRNIYGKQAEILLALDRGQSGEELSLLLKTPEPEIEALKSKFEEERLSIFPFAADKGEERKEEREEKSPELHFQPGTGPLDKGWMAMGFEEWTPEALFEYYGADGARAKKAASHALALYDELAPYHGLGPEERDLLEFAALLQDIGSSVSPEEKIRMSREILLTHPLKGLSLHGFQMLALITELRDPGLSEKDLISTLKKSHTRLHPGLQNKTLMLAALIRTADLFEARQASVYPGKTRQLEGALEIEIFGPEAEKTAKKAEKRSELWKQLFGTKLLFTPVEKPDEAEILEQADDKVEEESAGEKEAEKKKEKRSLKFTVRPEDSMAGVAFRTFSLQFARMLATEKGTRKGEDPENLHDMRVAVRRMRAASGVFEDYLDSGQLEPHLKGLKRTLGALGGVRDLDVFREKAENYLKTLPPGNEHELDPLFAVLVEEREKARKNMLAYLNGEKYGCFKREFSEFLAVPEAWALPTTNEKHDALPHRVKDVLPSILYARFADIGAYAEWVEGPYVSVERLHRLRIAAKGLRYTFEFFEDVLGKDAKTMIKEFKALQDHLGDLHDAVVAIDLLGSYLSTGAWGPAEAGKKLKGKEASEGLEGVEAYLEYREEELQALLNAFPDAWAKVRSREFRQKIENAVENLYEAPD